MTTIDTQLYNLDIDEILKIIIIRNLKRYKSNKTVNLIILSISNIVCFIK